MVNKMKTYIFFYQTSVRHGFVHTSKDNIDDAVEEVKTAVFYRFNEEVTFLMSLPYVITGEFTITEERVESVKETVFDQLAADVIQIADYGLKWSITFRSQMKLDNEHKKHRAGYSPAP